MTFEELGVSEPIRKAIEELGFVNPMPIQEAVWNELLLPENVTVTSLIALAQTGTGKTAAFGIPLLQNIDADSQETQALIVAPTRELCVQIADDLNDFAKYLPGMHILPVYGGTGMEQQMRSLRKGAQVVVATPGRLIDLKNRDYAHLDKVRTIVLDEADEMLNMGFQESITEIFESVPQDVHKLMFSATMSRDVERVAKGYMGDYKEIVVGSRNEGAENVNHIYYLVHAKDKYLALKRIVDYYPRIYAIIFCRTKLETQDVADKLIRDGYNAESLHGDLSQPQRDQTMQKFRQHTVQLLVATDVAARGLDVDDLTHVINYGLPDDIESYTHRSGRTGRAGKSGTSISIVHTKEKFKIKNIEKEIGKKFVDGDLPKPEEICTKQLYKAMDQIMKTDVEEEQIAPFMTEITRHFEYVDKEDLLKKIVSMTFGRFLSYYADAPEIEKPKSGRERGERLEVRGERGQKKGPRKVEAGYERLFINLGKDDGFYPGEVMQFLNKNMGGRQKVGHIDLFGKFAYIEVPKEDAENVMASLTGTIYKGREVRCNEADSRGESGKVRGERLEVRENGKVRGERLEVREASHGRGSRGGHDGEKDYSRLPKKNRDGAKARREAFGANPWEKKSKVKNGTSQKGRRGAARQESGKKDDWRQFFQGYKVELKGEEPDFSEEGWARRKRGPHSRG